MLVGSRGTQWRDIPSQHPLNSSYYDCHGGPPLSRGEPAMLQMLELRGRVVAIISSLYLSSK